MSSTHCIKVSALNVLNVLFTIVYMKSLIPKDAKSIFDQNRVTNITTLFSLPPTFRTHFWSENNEQKEDIVIQYRFSHRRVYKLAQRNAFFSEVTKVDLAPFGVKLFIYCFCLFIFCWGGGVYKLHYRVCFSTGLHFVFNNCCFVFLYFVYFALLWHKEASDIITKILMSLN